MLKGLILDTITPWGISDASCSNDSNSNKTNSFTQWSWGTLSILQHSLLDKPPPFSSNSSLVKPEFVFPCWCVQNGRQHCKDGWKEKSFMEKPKKPLYESCVSGPAQRISSCRNFPKLSTVNCEIPWELAVSRRYFITDITWSTPSRRRSAGKNVGDENNYIRWVRRGSVGLVTPIKEGSRRS